MPHQEPSRSLVPPVRAYSRRQRGILIACLLLLGLMGWVDYITGYELGFFIVYSVPVGLVAWHLGRWPAILTAFCASLAWWLADSCDGAKYSTTFFWIWNNVVHFLSFVINAVAIARIKSELDEARQLAAELRAVRAALQAVAPLLAACPQCGKQQPPPAATAPVATPMPAELAAALCVTCAAQTPPP